MEHKRTMIWPVGDRYGGSIGLQGQNMGSVGTNVGFQMTNMGEYWDR